MTINLKGITKESAIGVLVLLLSLINAILQMCGLNILPITNDDVTAVISSAFLVGSAIFTTYKNFNTSTAAQTAQNVTDAIKKGELLIEDIELVINTCRKD